MATNINLSNFFNQITGNNNAGGVRGNQEVSKNSSQDTSAIKSAVEQIKNMMIGDIFTGEINNLSGNNVSIRFGNGELLNANLLLDSNTFNINKGDMVTFLVDQKTDSSVALKPLDGTAQEMIFANKALEASGLPKTKENLELVKGLVDLNMPIDKNTLMEMSRELTKFPEASMDTILRLNKLEIPVTAENIEQFNAYKAYEHDMTGTIQNLSEDFTKVMEQLSKSNPEQAVTVAKELLEVFHPDAINQDAENVQESIERANQSQPNETAVSQDAFKEALDHLTKELHSAIADKKDVNGSLADQLTEHLKNNQLSDNEKLRLVQNMLKEADSVKDNESVLKDLNKVLSSKEFKELLSNNLKESMFIKPEDVADKKEVKEYYKNLLKTVTEGQKVLEKSGLAETDLAKGMNSVKNNVEFMNELNHQMAFLQIPLKLQNGETKGDLYVYTNKKKKLGKDDDLTALLHLDMANLGPMDVYVKLTQGNHVSTNFCLESEEMLDFIYEHIDLLTKRLNDQGYDFKPTMTVKEPSDNKDSKNGPVDFVKDFLEVSDPVIAMNRYIFDTKA